MALDTTDFGYIPIDTLSKDITVTSIPAYSREAVAEHTLLLMLSAAKRTLLVDRAMQQGKYKLVEGLELANKTLGVIGLGSIGSRVAELGRAVGMNVIAWDRNKKYLPGIEQVSLSQVLKNSDVISIHLSVCKETHHIYLQNN